MKKILTSICFVSCILYGYSQNIVLLDPNKNVISNSVFDITVASGASVTNEILVKNAGSIADTIKVVRIVQSADGADQTQFCWGGLCYLYTTNQSSLSLTIAPGDTVDYAENGFHGVFIAGAACVTRLVHYRFYNIHNFSDSTGVTFRYHCATAGLGELSIGGGNISCAYPNPANSIVSIKYDVNSTSDKGKIIFYDMLGKAVKEIIISDKQGIAKVNVSDMDPGVYFYTFMVNGKAVGTKKLVITH